VESSVADEAISCTDHVRNDEAFERIKNEIHIIQVQTEKEGRITG